jgi:hypothetical protein
VARKGQYNWTITGIRDEWLSKYNWFQVDEIKQDIYTKIPQLLHVSNLLDTYELPFDIALESKVRVPLSMKDKDGHNYWIHDCNPDDNFRYCHRTQALPEEIERYAQYRIDKGKHESKEGRWFLKFAQTVRSESQQAA